MTTLPLSEVKMKLSQLVDQVFNTQEEITITKNGRSVAMLISPEEFDSWRETLAIKSDPDMMAEIRQGIQDLKKRKGKRYTLAELFPD